MTHVMVWRGVGQEDGLAGFWHHGVRLTDDTIVHYSGMHGVKTLSDAVIQRTGLHAFAPDATRPVHVVAHPNGFPPHVAEQRALSQLGKAGYDLVSSNCETFARWCVIGESESRQAQGAVLGACAGAATLLTGGGFLGALVLGIAAAKMWDRGGNRSSARHRPEDDPFEVRL